MRFDLVDLQLFIAVSEARSISAGALRAHLALASASARIKGLEQALRRGTAQARPARRRTDRGGRKPARSCPHRHARGRCDARRSRRPMPAAPRPACICWPIPRSCRNICRRRWRRSCANIPTSMSMSRNAKAPISPPLSPAAPPISVSRPSMRCRTASSDLRSAKTAWCWSSARRPDQLLSSLIAASCTRGSPAAMMRPPLCAGLPSQVVTMPPAPVMIGISAAMS